MLEVNDAIDRLTMGLSLTPLLDSKKETASRLSRSRPCAHRNAEQTCQSA